MRVHIELIKWIYTHPPEVPSVHFISTHYLATVAHTRACKCLWDYRMAKRGSILSMVMERTTQRSEEEWVILGYTHRSNPANAIVCGES